MAASYDRVTSPNCEELLQSVLKFHFQTDYQKTLRMQIQASQGCQKIRNILRNQKTPITRSRIHPTISKIKNHYWKTFKSEKKIDQSIRSKCFTTKWQFLNWKLIFSNYFWVYVFANVFLFHSLTAGLFAFPVHNGMKYFLK